MTPDVLSARIDVRVCELRVLAAITAVQWGRVYERKRMALDAAGRGIMPTGMNAELFPNERNRKLSRVDMRPSDRSFRT
jgi:hypothetical protein